MERSEIFIIGRLQVNCEIWNLKKNPENRIIHPFIVYTAYPQGFVGGLVTGSLQWSIGERRGTSWTGRRSITGKNDII